ncbi:MAG: hypothetical protein AAGJ31_07510, partial [Verrucomicrobiota bacterium]
MPADHDIIADEWRERSHELATWAMDRLVNRREVWGQYTVLTPEERVKLSRDYKALTLPQRKSRGKDMVTLEKLARHFASRHGRKPQIIGLHAQSPELTSRWLGIDLDMHDPEGTGAEDLARRNLVAAEKWWRTLQDLGYDPLLFDSNGRGGLHLWVLFADPAPTGDVCAFARSIIQQWARENLEEEPEIFPRNPKPDSLGPWFRLPGLHHTQNHSSRLWSGDPWLEDPWLEGHAAIDAMLQVLPGPPPPVASEEAEGKMDTAPTRTAARRKARFEKRARPRICVDLDGVLARHEGYGGVDHIGEPLEGAAEFTQSLSSFAEVIILTSRLSGRLEERRSGRWRKAEERVEEWLNLHGF